MTTMELNLRKESLIDYIQSMDEEAIGKVEKYIRKLCNSKTAKAEPLPYPWAPDEEAMHNMVAEAEADYANGRYLSQDKLEKELKAKLASWE